MCTQYVHPLFKRLCADLKEHHGFIHLAGIHFISGLQRLLCLPDLIQIPVPLGPGKFDRGRCTLPFRFTAVQKMTVCMADIFHTFSLLRTVIVPGIFSLHNYFLFLLLYSASLLLLKDSMDESARIYSFHIGKDGISVLPLPFIPSYYYLPAGQSITDLQQAIFKHAIVLLHIF